MIDTQFCAAYAVEYMNAARVLVVDDDPWILRMVTATLEKRHYVVDTARDGQQALQRAHAIRPDIIITDLMMPVMDGWAFVQQLRTVHHLASVPVIFLTALGKDEAQLRSLGIAPQEYMSKPFRFDELERRVIAALSGEHEAPAAAPDQPRGPGVTGNHPQNPGYPPYPGPQAPAYPHYPTYPPGYGPYPGGPYGGAYPPGSMPPQHAPSQGYPAAAPDHPPAPAPVASDPSASSSSSLGSIDDSVDSLRRRRSSALNGRLEQLGLSSLLVMMEMERKDGVLTLKGGNDGDTGRIFIRKGQVIHAKLDQDQQAGGRESVYDMLRWQLGTFSFAAMEVDMEDTVQSSTTHLLMEGARLIDEAKRDEF